MTARKYTVEIAIKTQYEGIKVLVSAEGTSLGDARANAKRAFETQGHGYISLEGLAEEEDEIR